MRIHPQALHPKALHPQAQQSSYALRLLILSLEVSSFIVITGSFEDVHPLYDPIQEPEPNCPTNIYLGIGLHHYNCVPLRTMADLPLTSFNSRFRSRVREMTYTAHGQCVMDPPDLNIALGRALTYVACAMGGRLEGFFIRFFGSYCSACACPDWPPALDGLWAVVRLVRAVGLP